MIFLDASFIINFFVDKVSFHERAVELMESIKNEEKIISNLVITEVVTVLNIKLKVNKELTKTVYEYMNKKFEIVEDSYIYDESFKKVMKYKDRLSFFDCAYIALMEDLEIKEIVSFDKDFNNKEGIIRIY
ncbi:type II toxin-antitoxin system VapC family toxin [Methanobrevibacter filiformis]|uniref:tRNA(FMet)-specific endonuclease VapC n=1 Tax=Methanobrevibacter filiformis TaxID=55758 RepID=A0A166CFX2_9EURY|nr:PIN domain-containing protein [Methanobrevibacter filiformis]KZX14464.1 tRNA(fMet)-specific endonuclease VapC [Methanobrevibacter filiformis]